MNEAIKLAVEKGGYDWKIFELGGNYFIQGTDIRMHTSDIILDNQFWQALGKALGWNEHKWEHTHARGSEYDELVCKNCDLLKKYIRKDICSVKQNKYAHQYFDLVLTGGDTERFWKELLSSNSLWPAI